MGLETVTPEGLRATHRSPSLACDMSEAIATIRWAGIEIVGSCVLGLDRDDTGVLAPTAAFAGKDRPMVAQFCVLTPYLGTEVHRQLEEEGRIEERDWSAYTMGQVVFRPLQMTAQHLETGQKAVHDRFYSIPSMVRRVATGRARLGPRLLVNLSCRRLANGKPMCKSLPSHRTVEPSPAETPATSTGIRTQRAREGLQ